MNIVEQELREELRLRAFLGDWTNYELQQQVLADYLEEQGIHPAVVRMHRANWEESFRDENKTIHWGNTWICNYDCRDNIRSSFRYRFFNTKNSSPILHFPIGRLVHVGGDSREHCFPLYFFDYSNSADFEWGSNLSLDTEVHPLGFSASWLEDRELEAFINKKK